MPHSRLLGCVVAALILGASATAIRLRAEDKPAAGASQKDRFFEMRVYHAGPGKFDALHARFRDHTLRLFKKHDIESIAYWAVADDATGPKTTLVFILAYPSKAAREASWKAFAADPEWVKAKDASEKDGKLVEKVDQTFMTPTDYSPLK